MNVDRKVAILIGLACAALAQFLALLLAGAGHGWITPFYASIALWALIPLSFLFASREYEGRKLPLLALLVAAAGSDIALLVATRNEGVEYFYRMLLGSSLSFTFVWLALWFSWQIVVVIALARCLTGGRPQ